MHIKKTSSIFKDWFNSWFIYKKIYSKNLQQDILIYTFFRSFFFKNELFNLVKTRIYRINNFILVDLDFVLLESISKIIFNNLIINLTSIFLNFKIFFYIKRIFYSQAILSSCFIAYKISKLLEKRIKFKSKTIRLLILFIKKYLKGIFIICSGRITNSDIAKTINLRFGITKLKNQNLIFDYGLNIANTFKGLIGIKVWILK